MPLFFMTKGVQSNNLDTVAWTRVYMLLSFPCKALCNLAPISLSSFMSDCYLLLSLSICTLCCSCTKCIFFFIEDVFFSHSNISEMYFVVIVNINLAAAC